MNKKLFSILILIALVAFMFTMAPGTPPPEPTPTPPPEPGYCSPGFWKQPHHIQYWVDHSPGDPYGDSGMTLLQALQGGKDTRVSRFVVAGWLNAANPYAPCD